MQEKNAWKRNYLNDFGSAEIKSTKHQESRYHKIAFELNFYQPIFTFIFEELLKVIFSKPQVTKFKLL